jgi:L-ascorbate metabolism protein UlaG (beta-lactamase superfamily)
MPQQTLTLQPSATGEQPNLTSGTILFIGTATVLMRFGGFTILTDPNFLHSGEKVRLGYGLRSTRRTNPAMEIEDLPPLDLVVLSHMHEDHFDRVAEQKLDKSTPIVSTAHATAALEKAGFTAVQSIEKWESLLVTKGEVQLRISAMPGEHGPGFLSKALPPVMGSMLEFNTTNGRNLFRMYITGDTIIHEALREIPRRYPDIDLALLHLGGTRVAGLLLTMNGKQGVQMLKITKPRLAIPIHFNDYTVFKSPLRDFARQVKAAGLEKQVRYIKHGETYRFDVADGRG